MGSRRRDWSTARLLADESLYGRLCLFRDVQRDSISHYLGDCSLQALDSGESLLTPDSANRSLFVVLEGALDVRLEGADGRVIATLAVGDCAGELSVIDRRRPSATVYASVETLLLAIPFDTLWALVNASHAFARNLLAVVSGRIRDDNRVIVESEVISRHYRQQSVTDALTGLYNRRWMDEFFEREIARCHMSGMEATLVIADVDGFRDFNNRYGHLVGDHVLGFVAESLQLHFRADDLVARYGGDEFAALLPELTTDQARAIAERVRATIDADRASAVQALQRKLGVTISLGLAALEPGDRLDSLLRRADAALYRAKKAGRNRVSL